jgi:hypothetical protein
MVVGVQVCVQPGTELGDQEHRKDEPGDEHPDE